MKKSIIAFALLLTTLPSYSAAKPITESTGVNGVTIKLSGDFYNPSTGDQMLQKDTPVIKFAGVNKQGGIDIVKGYTAEFGSEIYKTTISDKLAELEDLLTKDELARVDATKAVFAKHFPEMMEFYAGIGEATGYKINDVYRAAWASDGMFSINVRGLVDKALPKLRLQTMGEATSRNKGCTTAGWNNGVQGMNQDMPISLGGYGAIWKSDDLIVTAPEPFFMGIGMNRGMSVTINTVDTFNEADAYDGLPTSGVSMGMLAQGKDNARKASVEFDSLKINSASAYSMVDMKGNALSVEIKKGPNTIIMAQDNGSFAHTNHPVGLEKVYADDYAGGDLALLDSVLKGSFWRKAHADLYVQFAPVRNSTSLKDLLSQRPLYKQPYLGEEFVSVNTIIFDLPSGSAEMTTWVAGSQDFTKVSFD